MANLHPATLAVRQNDVRFHPGSRLRKVFPDFLGDRELLFLESIQSAQTATVRLQHADIQPGDHAKQLQRGKADVQRPQVTGGEVGRPQHKGPECGRRSVGFAQTKQEFTDVEERAGKLLRAREVEDPAVLVAKHQAAACGGKDDVDSLPHRRKEQPDVPASHLSRPPEIPHAETRDAAAALGRDDDFQTVRLQDFHGGLAHVRLVRIREAAVEIGDFPAAGLSGGGRSGPEPSAKGGVFVAGEVPAKIDFEQGIQKPAEQSAFHQRVDDF